MASLLPIDGLIPRVIQSLRDRSSLVLKAPPGAGKTTRIPAALVDAGLVPAGQEVAVLEPRRIAARMAARRVSSERGQPLGGEVGYRVRFESATTADTRICYETEGVLLRRLLSDPMLERTAAVILDEFHERSADGDLSLALLREVQETVRPDLRLVVMSATLDPARIAAYLGGCPVLESEGRAWPVAMEHRADHEERPMAAQIAAAVERCVGASPAEGGGSVLVFVPGAAEIRAAMRALEPLCARCGYELYPLHGDLPVGEQDRAVLAGPRPRVVVATNLAEASITVEGVTVVIDTGLARVLRRDPRTGLNHLATARISRASAAQRAGRAGRTAPGRCVRLYSEAMHASLPEEDEPEIRRVDPSEAILGILAWGARDPSTFPWLDPPDHARVQGALDLLRRLGAVEEGAPPRLTARGRDFLRLPVHPRHAAILIEGAGYGIPREVAAAVALLSERDLRLSARAGFAEARADRSPTRRGPSDLLERIDDLRRAVRLRFEPEACASAGIDGFAARRIARAEEQLSRVLARTRLRVSRAGIRGERVDRRAPRDEALLRALAAGYPDRVVCRRAPGSALGVMVGGAGVRLDASSVVREAGLYVALEAAPARDADGRFILVRTASEVRAEWLRALFPARWREDDVVLFDPREERVVGRRRTFFEDLLVEERETGAIDPEAAAGALFAAAARTFDSAFVLDGEMASLLARLGWMERSDPEARALAGSWSSVLQEAARQLCHGRRSFDELRRAPLLETFTALLPGATRRRLDAFAPARITLPSGRSARLEYGDSGPPILAARLQEFFGTETAPRVGGGTVIVLLQLLAPNQRPVQVTQDLASFWKTVYPQIRGELRRRYPRHAWPDDPLRAVPERGPKRRETR